MERLLASSQVKTLVSAVQSLLNSPDLNLDELEPATRQAIEEAYAALESVKQGLQTFRVRYARLVLMETQVQAESAECVRDDGRLPGVFEGIPVDQVPSHVQDVQDFDWIWEVKPD